VQIDQFLTIFVDSLFTNSFVNRAGYFLNKSELEEVLKNVEALLKYILLLGLVSLPLLFEKTVLFFTTVHQYKILVLYNLIKAAFRSCPLITSSLYIRNLFLSAFLRWILEFSKGKFLVA